MPETTAAPTQPAAELGLSMTKILRNPLLALRASMESLAGELGAHDPRAVAVRNALEQVLVMSRGVETLVSYASPSTIHAQRCSVAEILSSARRGLRYDQAARVEVADESAGAALDVDCGLLAGALHCLLVHALVCSTDDVLVCARRDGASASFTIVEGQPPGGGDPALRVDLPPGEVAAAKLGFEIACRDVARLGGRLTIERTPLGNGRVLVQVPSGEAASAR